MRAQPGEQNRSASFDKRTLLRAHPFFKGLDHQIIEYLLPHALTRKAKAGTVLFEKGDLGTKLYVVCTGAVRISTPSNKGKDAVFSLIAPGEIFGEVAFIDGRQRTADAVMIEPGELMVIERRDFLPLLQRYPEIAMRLLEILCGRLRRTSEQVEDIVFFSIQVRLAKALLYLHERTRLVSQTRKIHITQQEISQMIGVTRESANKQLRIWQRQKLLKLERGGLIILAPDALKELISEDAG